MDDIKVIGKLKVVKILCQYSAVVLVIGFVNIIIHLLVALDSWLVEPQEWIAFCNVSLLLISFAILLSADGKNRKNVIGISFLVYSLLYLLVLVINNAGSLLILTASFIAVFGILLFLRTRGWTKGIDYWKKAAYIVFIVFAALQVYSILLNNTTDTALLIFNAVTVIIPETVLCFVAVQAFDGKFYSHFIKENPKYFIPPGKPVDRENRRVLLMWLLGGFIVVAIIIGTR